MNNLMIFEGNEVEVFELDGQVLFNPYHVGNCLDISDDGVRKAMTRMSEKQVIRLKNSDVTNCHIRKLNNAGENFLTESGVYKLIFKSRKERAEKFQDWVTDEVLPSIRKTGTYTTTNQPKEVDKIKLAEAKVMNAKSRMANMYYKLANVSTLSKEYKNILVSKASEVLAGKEIIPLPKSVQKTYSATNLAEIFGVNKQKIGSLTNMHNLKTDEYGEWYRSKSEYSNKEVDTFVYYDTVIPVLRKILNVEVV